MKNRLILFFTAILLLLPTGNALSADSGFAGWVELGGMAIDDDLDGAKASEYEDIDNNILGGLMVDWYQDSFYFGVDAAHIGLDDQSYTIKGGNLSSFTLELHYMEIPHNLSLEAGTFYREPGSDPLVIGDANPRNESTWTSFDYRLDRQRYGFESEFLKSSPYFVEVNVNREEIEGQRPLGTGSFSGAVELPEPVDYTTNNIQLVTGYRAESISFKLSGLYSSFENDHVDLQWENPFTRSLEENSLPLDSDYGRIGAQFSWRQLPLQSAWIVKTSYANLSGELDIAETSAGAPAGLNTTVFDGDISTIRLSTALASKPVDRLATKIFYDFYDRENDSTEITYNSGSNDIHLFDYQKHRLGAEADYRLPAETKIGGGYTFVDIDRRNRPDADGNTDNELFLKAENSSLDFLTASLKYTYLNREVDEDFDLEGLDASDAEFISQFVSRYDYASKDKHALKFAIELYPMEKLDFGASYTYVTNDYDEVVLGREKDTGHEFYVDFVWRMAKILSLNGFVGYETYESDSTSYNHRAGFEGQTADPTVEDGSPASYVWSQSVDEDFWTVALGADMPIMNERLVVSLFGQYQQSDGKSDFAPSTFTSIDEFEDYYITTLESKLTYALTEAIALKVGYQYKKSNYDDAQYNEYDPTTGATILSGAYADHDYEVHIGYLTVRYRF